jgi:hypothetical protein
MKNIPAWLGGMRSRKPGCPESYSKGRVRSTAPNRPGHTFIPDWWRLDRLGWSLFGPTETTFNRGKGHCSSLASSHGAAIQISPLKWLESSHQDWHRQQTSFGAEASTQL